MTNTETIAPRLEMSSDDFSKVVEMAADIAGLAIPDTKKSLVQSRLSKRMRQIGANSFKEYLSRVSTKSGDTDEGRAFLSALTTNVSSFYRENHHFEFFVEKILPMISRKLAAGERARFWSAGCSSGQEAYTLAMEILAACPKARAPDLLILGSDIDSEILRRAEAATYSESEISGIPSEKRKRFVHQKADGQFVMNDEVRSLVRFKELNIHGDWPMRGPFDAIFCRNVVIYFDEAHQQALWPRFNQLLKPDGYLFLGHSERIYPLDGTGFAGAGVTIYRKV